ncbi:MAG: hypothetical protein AAFO79_07090 [Pseudomonadota bacterium]
MTATARLSFMHTRPLRTCARALQTALWLAASVCIGAALPALASNGPSATDDWASPGDKNKQAMMERLERAERDGTLAGLFAPSELINGALTNGAVANGAPVHRDAARGDAAPADIAPDDLARARAGQADALTTAQATSGLDGTWISTGRQVMWQTLSGFRAIIFQQSSERHAAATSSSGVSSGATGLPLTAAPSTSGAGPIVFQGWQIGRRLVGRSQFFASGCSEPLTFVVRGWLSPGNNRAVLTGDRPAVADCKVDTSRSSFPETIVLNRK